mmetsp:Transcript_49342/g.127218  ORF Transcript_49342/g.127218 Transcript_49342/m.127218 type:complete len:108 (+) Transcript_49342:486-809(+)
MGHMFLQPLPKQAVEKRLIRVLKRRTVTVKKRTAEAKVMPVSFFGAIVVGTLPLEVQTVLPIILLVVWQEGEIGASVPPSLDRLTTESVSVSHGGSRCCSQVGQFYL